MKKLRKLLKKPGIFFRDAMLNRYPLEKDVDVNRNTQFDNKPIRNNRKNKSFYKEIYDGVISSTFKVDVVFTWVDADDLDFQKAFNKYKNEADIKKPETSYSARFESRDELKYSLRSIWSYAPWVNHIYIVTNGQIPDWLNLNHHKVSVIDHSTIIPSRYLPTFNSHVIESCLHNIPNLTEHYVYFNDDVLLLRPTRKSNFFTENGLKKSFVSSAHIPNGPKCDDDTPSLWAIKNSRKLLFEQTGFYFNQKFAHTFHPQLRSTCEAVESAYTAELDQMRGNRFRSSSDLLLTSWLYPCLSYTKGKAIFAKHRAWYFNIRDNIASAYYTKLLRFKGKDNCPVSVCLNDHLNPNKMNLDTGYSGRLNLFLNEYYPDQAPWEINSSLTKTEENINET